MSEDIKISEYKEAVTKIEDAVDALNKVIQDINISYPMLEYEIETVDVTSVKDVTRQKIINIYNYKICLFNMFDGLNK